MSPLLAARPTRLFVVLAAFFAANAIIAEFVGVKIFALEATLGLPPFGWNLFGQSGSLSFTAGVLLWPVVFVLTDIVNEYFGRRGVRFISFVAVGLICYAFLFAYLAIRLAPATWWVTVNSERGVPDMQAALPEVRFHHSVLRIDRSASRTALPDRADCNTGSIEFLCA